MTVDVFVRIRIKTNHVHKAVNEVEEAMPPSLTWLPIRVVTDSIVMWEKIEARKLNIEFRKLVRAQDETDNSLHSTKKEEGEK